MLIADDARSVAIRLRSLIESISRYEVVGPVFDGAAALRLIEERMPDAAILDFAMPGASGLEVVRAIRAQPGEALVIVISHMNDESIRRRCLEAGADHFVSKSADLGVILDLLEARFGGDAA